jgi:CBS domain containing-hemolysin-like protein
VIGESPDEIVGIVHVKHAVGVSHEQRAQVPVREVMAAPVLVPSTIELDPLLATLRNGGLQMAVVVDEFGGVDGIVTFEDVVEEIVGEVTDEHDRRDPAARHNPDGSWTVSGLLRPDEATRLTGLMLPEDDEYETLGGLLGLRLAHLPELGESIELRSRTCEDEPRLLTLTVARMDGLRVDRIRLAELPLAEPAEDREGPP